MLQSAEIFPIRRRALRRSVHLTCDVIGTEWEDPVSHLVTDLSPYGCWLDTPFPLRPETEVALSFTPPRWHPQQELLTFARVRRRARTGPRRGMGLEFLDLSAEETADMRMALRGLPPPLATRQKRPGREFVWVDSLLTWTEDLGDRVNTYSVSDMVGVVDEEEFEFEPLASPMNAYVA
ncbi:MAG: PilZ domain-containing protein [Deltaproteobacteria bacterium]|nr:PilZ domain-containing protein [Deltaproteobacteria bacterium]